jgi:hypothetical protein
MPYRLFGIDRDEFRLGETTFLAVDVGGHEQGMFYLLAACLSIIDEETLRFSLSRSRAKFEKKLKVELTYSASADLIQVKSCKIQSSR